MTIETGTEHLHVALRERVAILTLNRPEARNALSPEMSAGLRQTLAQCRDNPDVGAVLITGAGSAFCSGGDVKGMGQGGQGGSVHDELKTLRARHHGTGAGIFDLRVPTIAALPGAAAGAGLAIALACDLRIAARSAILTTGYARIGLSGDYGIAWLLTRTVGPSRARELMLTAERIDMERAERIGLVHQVVAAEDLPEVAFERARTLAKGPRVALEYIKDNLDEALEIDYHTAIDHEAARLQRARTTADHREAVAAFREKREPNFRGE